MKPSRYFFIYRRLLSFSTFLILLSIQSFSQVQTQKPVTVKLHNNLGGYLESLPVDYTTNPQKKYPLIIFFHGIGEVGNGSAASLEKVAANGIPRLIKQGKFPTSFRSGGKDYSFIVISPQYVAAAGHEAYVGEVIKHCLQKYRVDEERIYITGLSMGGGVAYGYSSSSNAAAGQIAAALYVCPAASVNSNRSKLLAASGLPVWATHSRGDAVVKSSISVNLVNGINEFKPKPAAKLTIFESNSHDAWSKTYDLNYRENGLNVYEWMLQYKRTKVVPDPPVANAGAAQTITLPVNYVRLDGSGSKAQSGIATYAWTKVSGPEGGNITTPAGVNTEVTGLVTGTYEFRLKVTDKNGTVATSSVNITVKPAVLPPVADAGSAQVITLPVSSVIVNGSRSSAASGTITGYEWTYVSGPSVPAIVSPASVATEVSGLVQGDYVFRLKVTDSNGKTSVATVSVTVLAAPPPPRASAGNDVTIQLPINSITLDGSGSKAAEDTIESFSWTKVSGPTEGVILDEHNAMTEVNGLKEGIYEFQLEVTDASGQKATDIVIVTVTAAAAPPVAEAGEDIVITLPENTVLLDGSESSGGGTIVSWQWQKVAGPEEFEITQPLEAQTTVTGLVQGTYRFELEVTDDKGLSATDILTVEVKAPVPPVAVAGDDITIRLPENTVVLDGSGSSGGGTIVSWEWQQVAGPEEFEIEQPAEARTTVTRLVQGIYRFELKVTNDQGVSAADTLTIEVKAPAPPVAVAGDDTTIRLPESTVVLDGSRSTAISGTIDRYEWEQLDGNEAILQNGQAAVTEVSGLTEGTYTFRLTVTTNEDASASDTILVTVKAAPGKVLAIAGDNISVQLPQNTVTLDGSGSVIPADVTATHSWRQLAGAGINFTDPEAITTEVSGLTEGTYSFELTITAGETVSADTVTVTVKAAIVNLVAAAGEDILVQLPDSIAMLDGSGSVIPPEGSIQWKQLNGDDLIFSAADKAVTEVSGWSEGIYLVELAISAYDITVTDTIEITVKAAKIAPAAQVSGNITISLPENEVLLDGSASTGNITQYRWMKVSGPAGAVVENANAATTTIKELSEGVFVYELEVTDSNGLSSTAAVTITVKPAPLPPVPNAGTAITVTLPVNSVTLDGSKSTGGSAPITHYAWRKISGPADIVLHDADQQKARADELSEGEYVFELKVTNADGQTASAKVKVTVKATPPPPVADAGNNQVIELPLHEVLLNGAGSYAPGGSIVSYQWTKISGPEGGYIDQPSAAETNVSGLSAGVYEFRLTVTDNHTATAGATVIVAVKPKPVPPVANAGTSLMIRLPVSTVTLDGSKSAAGSSSIVSYTWTKTAGVEKGTITTPNAQTTTVTGLVAGTYTFELKVTDENNLSSTATVTVTVEPAPVRPPVANAGSDLSLQLPSEAVQLDGRGSYALDGTITGYNWVKLSGPAPVSITGAHTSMPSLEFEEAGTYIVRLTVTDSNGSTAYTDLTIVVVAATTAPEPPVASTGADQVLVLPETETILDGSASYTNVGNIVAYEWTLISGDEKVVIEAPSLDITRVKELTLGEYLFELTVTDSKGLQAKDTVRVTVNNAGGKPDQTTSDVKIYPNPILSSGTLELNGSLKGRTIVSIYDMKGKLQKRLEFVKDDIYTNHPLDISTLPKGVYFAEVVIDYQFKKVLQVIKL